MFTEDQLFWTLMVVAPILVLLCVYAKQIESAARKFGISPGPDIPALSWLRVVGASVGIFVAIAAPLMRWWLDLW